MSIDLWFVVLVIGLICISITSELYAFVFMQVSFNVVFVTTRCPGLRGIFAKAQDMSLLGCIITSHVKGTYNLSYEMVHPSRVFLMENYFA